MQKLLAAALVASALFVGSSARAQPNYPAVIQDYLQAVRKPPCKICHADGVTGFGTVTTDFAKNMLTADIKPYNEDSVREALRSLDLSNKISNKYRKDPKDVEVLRRGGDPNDENPIYLIEDPQYGCGGATFAARSSVAWPASLLVVLGLALARRRAKR